MVFTIVVFPYPQEYFLCTYDSYQRRPGDQILTESNEDHNRFYIITPDEQCFSCSVKDPWLQTLIKRCPRRNIKDLDIVRQLRDKYKEDQAKQEEPYAPPDETHKKEQSEKDPAKQEEPSAPQEEPSARPDEIPKKEQYEKDPPDYTKFDAHEYDPNKHLPPHQHNGVPDFNV
jgi:hypothetical protein